MANLISIRFRRFIRKIRKEKKKRTILRVRDSLVFISPLFKNQIELAQNTLYAFFKENALLHDM